MSYINNKSERKLNDDEMGFDHLTMVAYNKGVDNSKSFETISSTMLRIRNAKMNNDKTFQQKTEKQRWELCRLEVERSLKFSLPNINQISHEIASLNIK